MLKSFSYSVLFPSTGRRFSNTVEFAPGLTAITGRNESGKSLIVEMLGYALFGRAALRAAATEYEDLRVDLVFDLFGNTVRIIRSPKYERLLIADEEAAIGTDALNKTIPQMLGFDLAVFNATIAAQQDNLNTLTEMRPTARAKMVDDLTGMDRLEGTEKECKQQAKNYTLIADTLSNSNEVPLVPAELEGYLPEQEIEQKIKVLQDHQHTRNNKLSIRQPELPEEPVKPDIDLTIEELEAYEQDRVEQTTLKSALEVQLSEIPRALVDARTLHAAELYAAYTAETARRGPQPRYTRDQLEEFTNAWRVLDHKGAECPKCGFKFEGDALPETPPITLHDITTETIQLAKWSEPLEEVTPCYLFVPLEEAKQALARSDERRALSDRLERITVPPSRAEDLASLRAYAQERVRYDERRASYELRQKGWEEAQAALASLPDVSEEIKALTLLLYRVREHDRAMALYNDAVARYEETITRVTEARESAEHYSNAAHAIKLTRNEMKQELAPSISKAASMLLYSLTDGERQQVVVDYEFNVWVDGQPLHTLSGSGKAVVNLALRIGMGQVLTGKVLSLFIGDEIDGSMDAHRAGATHGTFRELAKHLDQVILITHKDIEADHIISL
jgi:exonuclease SbcC